jgi:hypothetical protein
MKVKVGDAVYDGTDVAIMVIVEPEDSDKIKLLDEGATRYAKFPNGYDVESAKEWMRNG